MVEMMSIVNGSRGSRYRTYGSRTAIALFLALVLKRAMVAMMGGPKMAVRVLKTGSASGRARERWTVLAHAMLRTEVNSQTGFKRKSLCEPTLRPRPRRHRAIEMVSIVGCATTQTESRCGTIAIKDSPQSKSS